MQEHMLLHTDQPEKYMAEVERNLITPMSFATVTQQISSTVNQTKAEPEKTKYRSCNFLKVF